MSKPVHEGMVKKGGQNAPSPTTQRPAPPMGSGGSKASSPVSQELTHAEWLWDFIAWHASPDAVTNLPTATKDRLRTIASLLATETPGIASYCGDRLVAIQCDQRDGDEYRTMLAVEVVVMVRKAKGA